MNSEISTTKPNPNDPSEPGILAASSSKITQRANSTRTILHQWELSVEKLCSICAETKPRNQFFIPPNCTHYFCNECISKYVTTKLQEQITTVKFPDTKCNMTISPNDCKGVVLKQVLMRWETAIVESMTLVSETTLYCLFKDCSSLLINDKAMAGSAECPSCHRLFCTECKVGWHAGIECAEFQRLGENDRKYEDLLAMNLAKERQWRRCPKCSFYVEKIDGCSHITCRCRYQFCYHCGSAWSNSHMRCCA